MSAPTVTRANREVVRALRHRWRMYLGIGYLLLALSVTLNVVLVAWGSPAVGLSTWVVDDGKLPGAGGLAVLGLVGLIVVIVKWSNRFCRKRMLCFPLDLP